MSELVSELAEKFMEGARKSGYLQMEEDIPSTFPLDCLPKDLQAYVLDMHQIIAIYTTPVRSLTAPPSAPSHLHFEGYPARHHHRNRNSRRYSQRSIEVIAHRRKNPYELY